MPSQNSAKSLPTIQHKQHDAECHDGMAPGSCQPQRPVSWAESTSELLASGSETGQAVSEGVGSTTRRYAQVRKLPIRANTVAANSLSLRVELAERQYIHQATGWIETPKKPHVERTRSAPSKPTYPPTCIQVSGSAIELDDMSSRPIPTQSTDHLVPSVDGSHTDQVSSLEIESAESTMVSQGSDKPLPDLRPNYKPLALRWPFRVFLLALLAGMLAFLEYHIHDLPSPHYTILPANRSLMKKLVAVAAAHHPATDAAAANTRPTSLSPMQLATMTTKAASAPAPTSTMKAHVTRPAKLRYHRRSPGPDPDPDPNPDPRPPDDDYPVPDYYYDMYQTYCGWSAPTWTIDHWGVPCSELSCDEFPIRCSNSTDQTQLQCSLFELMEAMDTFLTDDPTWCPCGVWQPDHWATPELIDLEFYWWDTIDRGCKSAMLAIQSLNHFKSVELYRTVSLAEKSGEAPVPTPYTKTTLIAQQFYTTPPLPARAWWPYPSYSENGDILMPFVVRTAGREVKDVYGNRVGLADVATFPDGFQSMLFEDGDFNHCWGSLQRYNLKTGQPGWCTDPPHVIISSVWWPLPLHPKTATAITTTMDISTTTSVLQPGASTSTTEVPSTSTLSATVPSSPASSIQDQTPTGPSIQSTVNTTHPGTASSTQKDAITQSTETNSGTTPETSSTSASEGPVTESTRDSVNLTPTSSSSSNHHDSENSPMSTDKQPETSSTLTTEMPFFSTTDSRGLPLTTSSARSELVHDTRQMPDATLTTASTSSSAIVPIVGLAPGRSSSNSPSPVLSSGARVVGSQATAKQSPAQLITSLTTQFNPNGIPTRTFTTIISLAPSSLSQLPYIPPPPFIIPVGSGWIPYDDSNNGKPGPNGTDPGSRGPGPVSPVDLTRLINLRSEADYLMASVLPVLLASFLLIAVQIFNSSVNSILPFRALTFAQGSAAAESLLLSRSSNVFVSQPKVAYRFLAKFRDPLPFWNTLLASFALIMVPLSSEVIRLEFTKRCGDPNWQPEYVDKDDYDYPANWVPFSKVCAFGLRKSVVMIRVAQGVLVAMAAMVLVMGWLLTKWRSGMIAEPWSIASMASLLAGSSRPSLPSTDNPGQDNEPRQRHRPPDLAALLRRVPTTGPDIDTELKSTFQDRSFRLGFLGATADAAGKKSYGIEVTPPRGHSLQDDKNPIPRTTTRSPPGPPADQPFSRVLRRSTTLLSLAPAQSNNGQAKKRIPIPLISTLLFSTGLLILVLYYETTVIEVNQARRQTGSKYRFEAFMNSQSFGVRILFTAFGVVLSTFWDSYFLSTSESQIYHRLAQKDGGLPAERSILLSPAAHVFAGLWSSLSLLGKHTLNAIRQVTNASDNQSGTSTNDLAIMSTQDTKAFAIALATFFAKFMPILLSNIPFHNTVTWKMHEACTWMAVGVMGYMVLLLLLLFGADLFYMAAASFSKLPGRRNKVPVVYMPVRVNTIAGCMYYLCESQMLKDFRFEFESLSEPAGLQKGDNRKGQRSEERLRNAVVALDKRYSFGEMMIIGQGCSARATNSTRLAVDYDSQRPDESSLRVPPRLAGGQLGGGRPITRPGIPGFYREPSTGRLFGNGGRRPRPDGGSRTADENFDIERGR